MGNIENQVTERTAKFVDTLLWYVEAMNRIEKKHAEEVSAINMTFNSIMAEIKPEKKKKTRKKKSESTVQELPRQE